MTKSGLKTFVCSFILSLFMIFSINGAFLRVPPQKNDNLKISNQNITLFLKKEATVSAPLKTKEVKKIALSLPVHAPSAPPADEPSQVPAPAAPLPNTSSEEAAVIENYPQFIKKKIHVADDLIENLEIPLQKAPAMQEIKLAAADIAQPSPIAAKTKEKPLPADKTAEARPEKAHAPVIPLEKGTLAPEKQNKEVRLAQSSDFEEAHIALTSAQVPIASMKTEKDEKKSEQNAGQWISMKEKKSREGSDETPWAVAKGASHPVNQLLAEEKFFKETQQENAKIKKAVKIDDPIKSRKHLTNDYELQLASKTVDNILIPIPKEILEDETLTPKLVSSEDELSKEKEAELELKYKEEMLEEEDEHKKPAQAQKTEISLQAEEQILSPQKEESSSILKSLNSIFSSSDSNVRPPLAEEPESNALSSKIKKWKSKLKKDKVQKILPVEMRLSFQPNRAEISGQTLRWIKAFANKARLDNSTALEIRIDGTNFQDLQQKRLTLLHNILLHDGVLQEKINTVFTEREPNSFIIRTVKVNNNTKNGNKEGNKTINQPGRYLQW